MNLDRLDRYIMLASNGGIQPVILINKIELAEDASALLDEVAMRFSGVDVHGVSVHEGWNLESLLAYVQNGLTVAFVGSSGVGKSSLTNLLLGQSQMGIQEIRLSDGRGRHTTTHRELHLLPGGGFVIDTPGIRQVGMTEDMDLGSSFEDIESLFTKCKFTDCKHDSEPGCALREALNIGKISAGRWGSYLKLQKEVAFELRKANKALQSESKKKWAKIHKESRQRMKLRGK
jgi:ribosome biogenesis GTPase